MNKELPMVMILRNGDTYTLAASRGKELAQVLLYYPTPQGLLGAASDPTLPLFPAVSAWIFMACAAMKTLAFQGVPTNEHELDIAKAFDMSDIPRPICAFCRTAKAGGFLHAHDRWICEACYEREFPDNLAFECAVCGVPLVPPIDVDVALCDGCGPLNAGILALSEKVQEKGQLIKNIHCEGKHESDKPR